MDEIFWLLFLITLSEELHLMNTGDLYTHMSSSITIPATPESTIRKYFIVCTENI